MKCSAATCTYIKYRTPASFYYETVRKLLALHMVDYSRINKTMFSWDVEARVPFLDKKFLDVAMSINPKDKMCSQVKMEKHIIREYFESYLPSSVAWRQKEQFSDGVGYSCINTLKEVRLHCRSAINSSKQHASAFHTTRRSQKKAIYTVKFSRSYSCYSAQPNVWRTAHHLPALRPRTLSRANRLWLGD